MPAVYLDSSAIVKLVVAEPESEALRLHLLDHPTLVSSALARTEVSRALLPYGEPVRSRGSAVLERLELIRVSEDVLDTAGRLLPLSLRSLDAIHLATAGLIRADLRELLTYDRRMLEAAARLGFRTTAPS